MKRLMTEDFHTRETLLFRLADQHDDESWAEFVHYYQKFIYLVIRGMNIAHHDAEELTQEVLVKLWNKLPEFKYNPQKGRFRGWLCLITGNLVKDFIRCRKAYAEKLDSVTRNNEIDYLSSIALPEIEKLAREEWEKYISVMAWKNVQKHFSANVCQAFLMLREGKTRSEVAKELDLAENSISTYKTRITARLHEEIKRLDKGLSGI